MSIITVATPFNIDLEFKIAAFHKRLFAWFLDILIIIAFIFIMSKVLQPLRTDEEVSAPLMYFLLLLPAYSYHLILEILLNGQSVGKMATGIRVMDASGSPATISQYLLRWVFRLVDMGITGGVGAILSAAISKNTQRIGDLAAGTIVVDTRYEATIGDTIYLDITDKSYKVQFPQVIKLTDKDINGIRNLLNLKEANKDSEIYIEQVVHRIKEVLKIDTHLPARDFLFYLLQDYNYMTMK